jgi:hypothetical protein
MVRLVVLMLALAAMPAHAGFKMFGPNGSMNSSETDQEKAIREANEAEYQRVRDELRAQTARHANPPKRQPARYTKEQLLQGTPCEPTGNIRRSRPGGHRRHEWREKTGFNTPAHRTRYVQEIRRLNRELKKERARPNPYGMPAHKITGRKPGF